MTEIIIEQSIPDVQTYQQFKKLVGWTLTSDEVAEQGLGNSLYSVCAFHNEKIVGFGRVVGDGKLYIYLQDIIVHPEYQGQGIGRKITAAIMEYLEEVTPSVSLRPEGATACAHMQLLARYADTYLGPSGLFPLFARVTSGAGAEGAEQELEALTGEGKWAEADSALGEAVKRKMIPEPEGALKRAALLTERSKEVAGNDVATALKLLETSQDL